MAPPSLHLTDVQEGEEVVEASTPRSNLYREARERTLEPAESTGSRGQEVGRRRESGTRDKRGESMAWQFYLCIEVIVFGET